MFSLCSIRYIQDYDKGGLEIGFNRQNEQREEQARQRELEQARREKIKRDKEREKEWARFNRSTQAITSLALLFCSSSSLAFRSRSRSSRSLRSLFCLIACVLLLNRAHSFSRSLSRLIFSRLACSSSLCLA